MENFNQNDSQYKLTWQECLSQIKRGISSDEFSLWFGQLEAIGFDGAVLRLLVPSQSHLQHIEQNYIPLLRPIIRNHFGIKARISYTIPNAPKPAPESSVRGYGGAGQSTQDRSQDQTTVKNPFTVPGLKRSQFDSQLRPELSFRNHIEGSCNRLARTAGIAISQNPGTTSFNPLFIYGNSGLGKTHIAQAIGNATKERHPQLNVLYVSASHFQSQFQTAAWRGELSDFIHFYQMIDLLIVDDIQELAGKPGTQNIFFNIFNHLRLLGKQIILTSDRPPVELKDIEDRLITRFKWGLSAGLTLPDHQTKVSILQAKSGRMGISIEADIVDFLAENIKANIRELEGALTSLEAHSRLLGHAITMELTRRVMSDIVTVSSREVNMESIIDVVCRCFAIDKKVLMSSRRTREIAQARQVAMYLSKQHTQSPLVAIGSALGGKSHATVLHACKTVINLMETDKVIRKQVRDIESELGVSL